MSQPLVFDHTAIIVLFRAYPEVYRYWALADAEDVRLVLPAAAVAEANRMVRASWNAWESVLYPAMVTISPLDQHTAVEAGLAGDPTVGHVAYEARAVRGVLVTQAPGAYRDMQLPLLPI